MTMRPARLIEWAHDHIADGGGTARPFGFIGHSMGSTAGFGALHWGPGAGVDVDARVDAWVFAGGPAVWDLRLQCGDNGPDDAYLQGLSPMCEDDPTAGCAGELTEYAHRPDYGQFFTWPYDYAFADPTLSCSRSVIGETTRHERSSALMVQSSFRDIDSSIQYPRNVSARGSTVFVLGDDEQDSGVTGTGDFDGQTGSHTAQSYLLIGGTEWHVYRDYNHFWDLEAPEDNTGLDCPNERFCQDDEIQQRIVDHLSAALSQ